MKQTGWYLLCRVRYKCRPNPVRMKSAKCLNQCDSVCINNCVIISRGLFARLTSPNFYFIQINNESKRRCECVTALTGPAACFPLRFKLFSELGSCCDISLAFTTGDEAPRARLAPNMRFERAPNRAGNFGRKKGGEPARW